jgi:hypothetical protein
MVIRAHHISRLGLIRGIKLPVLPPTAWREEKGRLAEETAEESKN